MLPWGESEMLWSEAVTELVRWCRQRRAAARAAAALVAGAEAYLAEVAARRPPTGSPELT
jgi:hypothetical protein